MSDKSQYAFGSYILKDLVNFYGQVVFVKYIQPGFLPHCF